MHRFEANIPGNLPMGFYREEKAQEISISHSSYHSEVFQKFKESFELVPQNLEKDNQRHTNIEEVHHYFSV